MTRFLYANRYPLRPKTPSASGAGTLVAAEAPDDAALDHDGALGALLARDDAGGRSRYRAAGLLHFSQHFLVGQAYQRGGDFCLLLLIEAPE